MPLEVQGHTVQNFKALISGKIEPRWLKCGSTFMLYHALLKKAILLHTEGLVKTALASTVSGVAKVAMATSLFKSLLALNIQTA